MSRLQHAAGNARYPGRCNACSSDIARGEQVTHVWPPRRILCQPCGRAWRLRESAHDDVQRQAKALALRDPPD